MIAWNLRFGFSAQCFGEHEPAIPDIPAFLFQPERVVIGLEFAAGLAQGMCSIAYGQNALDAEMLRKRLSQGKHQLLRSHAVHVSRQVADDIPAILAIRALDTADRDCRPLIDHAQNEAVERMIVGITELYA